MNRLRLSLALLAALAAVPRPGAAAPDAGYDVAEYLGMTLFSDVEMSPDGKRVAFVTTRDDVTKTSADRTLWMTDAKPDAKPVRITHASGTVWSVRWSPSGRYLAFMGKRAGDDAGQLYVLDTTAGEPRRLTSASAFAAGIDAYDWAGSDDGLWVSATPGDATASAAREARYGKVIRYTTAPVKTTLVYVSRDTGSVERTLEIDGTVEELRVAPNGAHIATIGSGFHASYPYYDADELYKLTVYDIAGRKPPRQLTKGQFFAADVAWSNDGKSVYALASGAPNATVTQVTDDRLYRFDIAAGTVTTVADKPGSYRHYALLGRNAALATTLASTHTTMYAIDARGRHRVLREFPGTVAALAAQTHRGPVAFVLSAHDAYPELYIAPSQARLRDARAVTHFNDALTNQPRPTTQTVSWQSSDGTRIEGVLHWPPGKQGEKGLPLVVDIHGGPWGARTEALTTSLVYAYYPSLLASRGYLAMEVNYRGSIGRGDEFAAAINGHSCEGPMADILGGVDFVVEQGWADADRMAVMGYSYGGLLTNCIIGTTSRFKVAVSGAGLWDETAYFGAGDNWLQSDIRIGGTPWERRDEFWRQSAISRAANISTPTLVVTGAEDRRVPAGQARAVFRSLVRLGVPTELLIFPGQGHVFSNPQYKFAAVMAELDWLDHYLHGTPRTVFVGPGPDADAHAATTPGYTLQKLQTSL